VAALVPLQRAAHARGLDVRCVAADVRTWPFRAARYDLVVVVSFLERSLWPTLRTAVRPGGALLVETFVHDPSRGPAVVNPAFMLAPGELDEVCRGWDVIARHAGTAQHQDVAVARAGIAARRPHARAH